MRRALAPQAHTSLQLKRASPLQLVMAMRKDGGLLDFKGEPCPLTSCQQNGMDGTTVLGRLGTTAEGRESGKDIIAQNVRYCCLRPIIFRLSCWSQALRSTFDAFTLIPGPQTHVRCFHFGPRPSNPCLLLSLCPRLLLSLWSQTLKPTSAAFTLVPGPQAHVCCFHFAHACKSTSAAFTLVPSPQTHVCCFHFGPRPSNPRLLLSLRSQALKSTSAAFTLVPGPQTHVCCFHFGPRPSNPRLLLSLWSQALKSASAAFDFGNRRN